MIKEHDLDDKQFKGRMRDMCNLGEALELEDMFNNEIKNMN